MTKKAILHPDPLVMAVRAALKAQEPRPAPTHSRYNIYGHAQVKCPDCGEWCYAKSGSYSQHWTVAHGTRFWRELHIIETVKKGLNP